MRFGTLNGAVLGFLLLTSLAAVYVLVSPGSGDDWIINPLTGITAVAFGCMCFARLFVGAPNATARRIWLGIIAVLVTVAISQFFEGYRQVLSENFGIDDIANCVLLVVSPVTMWMIGKFDPPPIFARGLFLLGFIIQMASTVCDVVNAVLIAHWTYDTAFIDLVTNFGQFISLQIYLIAVAVFLVSLHLHQRVTAQGVRTVGQLSRYLFIRLRLFDKLRYPALPFPVPGLALGLWVVHLVSWVPIVGPQVRQQYGKSVTRQIVDVLQLGLCAGMDARAYYLFEIYRQGGLAASASYLTQFETRNGLFEAINALMARSRRDLPNRATRRRSLSDPLAFSSSCEAGHLPCISPLILTERGELDQILPTMPRMSRDVLLTTNDDDPAGLTELYRHIGASRYLGESGATFSAAELYARQLALSEKQQMLLLPRLINHPDLADICSDAAAVVHIVTCLTPGRIPIVTHAMLQLSDRPNHSWGRAPVSAASIQLEDGRLGTPIATAGAIKAGATGTGEVGRIIVSARLAGRFMPLWPEIQALALQAHAIFGDHFILGWDIACTPQGPVIVKASDCPDVERLQQVHRAPISESPLGPPLYQYLRLLEAHT